MNPLNMTRAERWDYIVRSLLGGMDDEAVADWIMRAVHQSAATEHEPLDYLMQEAIKLRDGMVAT